MSWRDSITIVLKKPKEDDYSVLKAYRLICFECSIAKRLEAA